ncbi:MAG TPA: CHAP domain-containing protein [Hymenobacter sp.]|jgi:surface antigen
MSDLRVQKQTRLRSYIGSTWLALLAVVILATSALSAGQASAVDYNAEIQKLQAQNDADATNRQQLQTSALTLEQQIADLRTTIANLETQLQSNQQDRALLIIKIEETGKQITEKQVYLGQLLRQLYIEGDISMMEKVASSKNMSDYVEKEQYNIAMQSKIKASLDHINKLKKQQESQKVLVEKLIADNKAMETQVSTEKQEVSRLLALNQTQQAEYTQNIATNSTEINDLQREQAEENLRFQREQAALAAQARQKAAEQKAAGNAPAPAAVSPPATSSPGVKAVDGRSYPYAGAPFPNEISDSWGMYQRQCVSYTAWKVAASGRHMPYWGGRGNAKQWDDNARAAGISVDSAPRVGDVGVRNAGTYGHVVYVDAVNGDGTIRISQYNAGWDGRYSEATIFPGDLVFIHFQ